MTDEPFDRAISAVEPALLAPASRDAAKGAAMRIVPARAVLPADCACCGQTAVRRIRETPRFESSSVLVPYCAECHRHASAVRTRRFATVLSVSVLTLTLLFGLPLIFDLSSAWLYGLVVAVLGALPIGAASYSFRRRPALGHAATGRAAFFRGDGVFVTASAHWGTRLAEACSVPMTLGPIREALVPWWGLGIPLLALGVAPLVFHVHFPPMRIVNLSGEPVDVSIDGRAATRVEPTSGESPQAGVEIRVPAGNRVLRAVDPSGRVVDETRAVVESGKEHFYAPGSGAFCFWIESTGYGRRSDYGTRTDRLDGATRFWSFADGVDLWFSPTPAADDGRTSGGILRAVRQARCTEAPLDAPAPAPAVGGARDESEPAPFATDRE